MDDIPPSDNVCSAIFDIADAMSAALNTLTMSLQFDPKLVKLDYYHGWLPREDVRYLLQRNGDFLVRITEADGKLDMILCTLYDEEGRYQDKNGPVEEEDVFNLIIHSARNKYYIGNFLLFKSVDELTNYYSKHSLAINDLKLKLRRPITLASWELRADELQLGKTIDKSGCIEIRKGLFKRENKNWETAVTSVRGRSAAAKLTIQEMMRQCRLLRDLHHPCVIEYYGVCLVTHPCCFLLEYVPGGPLDDYLKSKEGKMKKEEMLRMIVSAGWGLEFIHSNYIIHRDLSAKNCFYDRQMVKLSGFGLARKTLNYTMKALKKLAVNWMAPETLKDFRYSQKSDVYSFGVLVFEIFSQREPYEGVPSQEVKALILEGKLNDFPPETPKKLADYVLDKLWDNNPSKRPSMTEACEFSLPFDSRATVRPDPNAPAFKDVTYGGEHDSQYGVSTQSTVKSQTQRSADTRSVDTRRRPQSALSQPRALPGEGGGQPQPASTTEAENELEYENLAAVSMQHPSRLRTYQATQTGTPRQGRTPTQARTPPQARAPTQAMTPTKLMSTSPGLARGGKPYTSLKTGRTPSNLSFQPQSVKPATLPAQAPTAQTLQQQQMPEMQEQPGQMEYENLAALSQQQPNQQLPGAATKQYTPLSAQQRTGTFNQPIPGSPAVPTQRFTARIGTQQLQLQQQAPISAKGAPTRPISAQQMQQMSHKTPTALLTAQAMGQQTLGTAVYPEQGMQPQQVPMFVEQNIPVEQMGVQQVEQQIPFDNNLLPGMEVSPMAAQPVQQQPVSLKTAAAQKTRTRAVSAQQQQQMSYRTAQQMGQQMQGNPGVPEQVIPGQQIVANQLLQLPPLPNQGVPVFDMGAQPVQQISVKTAAGLSRKTAAAPVAAQQLQQMSYKPGGVGMKPMTAQQLVQQVSVKPATMPFVPGKPTRPITQPQQQFPAAAPVSAQRSAAPPIPGKSLQMQQQFPPSPGAFLPQGFSPSKMF
ncbi:unnamed protein product [Cylicocyclus nassatus]|uniref:Tyrosine-protein kinase n=1 Tax=Cylicocyclus nassatus TaxID=53992 RepID=A0AA36M7I1_CYLNA|nr:unnamed protein product [Cylicocyclus nassatus]